MKVYNVIGLMSGTSLDGVDIAYCIFKEENGNWKFEIRETDTINYSVEWRRKLNDLPKADIETITKTDIEYGKFLGESAKNFIKKYKLQIEFICSHGHTIFHQPMKGYTLQIGDGGSIALNTGITVVNNFRKLDVSLGGQGAPLVPIGDRLLFGEYDHCLNLGGFSNISFEKEDKRIAFDICPVNIVLNNLAEITGTHYDRDGLIARSGDICPELLNSLNNLEYYSQSPPKSLGKEWVLDNLFTVLNEFTIPLEDKLRTVVEHIAFQISRVLESNSKANVLVTGGGAYNTFLIESIKEKTHTEIVIPEPTIIEFKEAMIFAFLGTLRIRNEINCLSSVTGAIKDSSGGVIFSAK